MYMVLHVHWRKKKGRKKKTKNEEETERRNKEKNRRKGKRSIHALSERRPSPEDKLAVCWYDQSPARYDISS